MSWKDRKSQYAAAHVQEPFPVPAHSAPAPLKSPSVAGPPVTPSAAPSPAKPAGGRLYPAQNDVASEQENPQFGGYKYTAPANAFNEDGSTDPNVKPPPVRWTGEQWVALTPNEILAQIERFTEKRLDQALEKARAKMEEDIQWATKNAYHEALKNFNTQCEIAVADFAQSLPGRLKAIIETALEPRIDSVFGLLVPVQTKVSEMDRDSSYLFKTLAETQERLGTLEMDAGIIPPVTK